MLKILIISSFLRRGHVTAKELRTRFAQIEAGLLRYPAIDPQQFRREVEEFLGKEQSE